jgi:hypothetical protein
MNTYQLYDQELSSDEEMLFIVSEIEPTEIPSDNEDTIETVPDKSL